MIGPTSWLLLTLTVQVSALAFAIYLIQRLALRNHPKAAARLIAIGMILLLAVSAAVTLPLPSWLDVLNANSLQAPEAGEVSATPSLASIAPDEISNQPRFDAEKTAGGSIVWGAMIKNLAGEFSDDATTNGADTSRSMAWNGVVCFGVCFLSLCIIGFVRLLLGVLTLRRLRLNSTPTTCESTLTISRKLCERIGCDRDIEIRLSPLVCIAATTGFWNPRIFLADDFENWAPLEQKSVLAHEIAHIHHGDFAANIVSQICTSMHFFNPAVHWLVGHMRFNQEVAADQIASQTTSGPHEYTKTLATLALRQDKQNQLRLASMFIPNQNSFVRRIKMLQNANRKGSAIVSWATLTVTLIAAFVISGVRAPASTPNSAPSELFASQEKEPAFSTDYISNRPDQVVSFVRPSKLIESSMVKQFTSIPFLKNSQREFDKIFEDTTGLGTEFIDQYATVSSTSKEEFTDRSYVIIRTFEDNLENFKSIGEIVGSDSSFPLQIKRANSLASLNHGLIVDKQTILWCYTEKGVELVKATGRNAAQRAAWYPEFKKMAKRSVVVVGDSDVLHAAGSPLKTIVSVEQMTQIAKSSTFAMAIDVNNTVNFTVRLGFVSGADAKAMEGSIDDIKKTLKKLLWAPSNGTAEPMKSLATSGIKSLKELEAKTIDTTLELKSTFGINMKAMKAASGQMQKAAAKTQGMNNMRQLVLALHNYESAHGHFPPAAIKHESGHVHSWRVAILPFLEEADLYNSYRRDEPWDSEHNLAVTSKMPEIYKHPLSESETNTNFFAVVGPETLFADGKKMKFDDVTDAMHNTILTVEAIRDCHWTKPEDISFEEAALVETLGGLNEGTFTATLVDGSTHQIPNDIPPMIFESFLTIAGDEEFMLNEYFNFRR